MDTVDFFDRLSDEWDSIFSRGDINVLERGLDLVDWNLFTRVLEVGCATGIETGYILKRLKPTARLFAIDISAKMVRRAIERIHDARFTVNIKNFFEVEGIFDLILMINVLPHLGDLESLFTKSSQLLDRRGEILILHNSSREHINMVHSRKEEVKDHVLLPVETVQETAKSKGFSILNTKDDEEGYILHLQKFTQEIF
ncbi:Methyltransferase type 12 [Thermodesulfobium narugense DSM 14796]|uniref:Methyltransferase type 12 n=1 Tax=Thermodesulfobium narugense DSM 14796 TaxID=747365 RepID=M1E5C8_9BACT|nr:class I SAM-dependent methyltransferase [Thermodesulfobium narugense]AEE14997.1 Methyltransferase type 12 [Thermodesulfobium narugense DSM 14796]